MDSLARDVGYGEVVPTNDVLRKINRLLEIKDIPPMWSLPRSMQPVLYTVFLLQRDVCETNNKATFSVDQAFLKFTETTEKCDDVSEMCRIKTFTRACIN